MLIAAAMTLLAAFSAPAARGDTPPDPVSLTREDPVQVLTRENLLYKERVRALENIPAVTADGLAARNLQKLREIARDLKTQRQTMSEFERFVTWMTDNLSGYARYVQAGSVAAGFAKILPIPYAGQASVLTKFVSQGILSLNTASVSIKKYLVTSQQFIARVEAFDPAEPPVPAQISELAHLADRELLRDMNDVQQKLATTAEISSSALSFLESVNAYVGSTDEYWAKTKSLLSRKEPDKGEKSYLSESIANLRKGAANFNSRLKTFDEQAGKEGPLIKSVVAYDELIRELGTKVAEVKQ